MVKSVLAMMDSLGTSVAAIGGMEATTVCQALSFVG